MEKKKEEIVDPGSAQNLKRKQCWVVDENFMVMECVAIVTDPKDNTKVVCYSPVDCHGKEWFPFEQECVFSNTEAEAQLMRKLKIAAFEEAMDSAKETYKKARFRFYGADSDVGKKVKDFMEFLEHDDNVEEYRKANNFLNSVLSQLVAYINKGIISVNNHSFRKDDVASIDWGYKDDYGRYTYVTIELKNGDKFETNSKAEIKVLGYLFGI